MKLKGIVADATPDETLGGLLEELHTLGPISSARLHDLSAYKMFHAKQFAALEEQLVAAMGLFYKIRAPKTLYSWLIAQMGRAHTDEGGRPFTPVQASVRRALDRNQFVSISAPTSAGKSFSIRDFIANGDGDAVVVVPSRALIAEFLAALRRLFNDDRSVMILPFVDRVFTSRQLRRIFVLTPERARELFERRDELDIRVFFFDEAQMSEEPNRGIVFDVLVRRVRRAFPQAKIVFAHPFVENPEAQFQKHNLPMSRAFARSYPFGAVGKMHVFRHANGKDYFFSPYEPNGHHISNSVEFDGGFDHFAFSKGHSILVYVSKSSIYSGKFLDDFARYIDEFSPIEDPSARGIIDEISHLVGADESGHESLMISLLRKGVVIHHGSVPLEVRFLVEEFVRAGNARICFATSTLVQGVNMPFDVVWLDSMRMLGEGDAARSLALKNLIGRAGRLSSEEKFDYGFVFTKNPQLFTQRISEPYRLSEESIVETGGDQDNPDANELLTSIREGTFDEDLNLPVSKAQRLSESTVLRAALNVLDAIYVGDQSLRETLSGRLNYSRRIHISNLLQQIYEGALGRRLARGESAVFSEAVSLLLQTFQGRSFREIVGTRYSRIARRDSRTHGTVAFTQRAAHLPDITLESPYPLFAADTSVHEVSYDAVVFDTYDYLDEVASFCLADTFIAAFQIYWRETGDSRALKFVELIRFGTNDAMQILLMRYGFPPEDVEELLQYIQSISEDEITFRRTIEDAPLRIRELTAWYR